MFQFFNYAELFKPEEVIDYLRKSRSDDPTLTVEEVLQKHEAMLDDWAEKHIGGKVPPENKFYEVVSGETIKERPEFQKVLKMIESPKYKAIKVVEIQRLSRGDLEDAGRLIKLLRYTETYVITPQKVYDLTDEYDREFFERELKRGNEYLEYTKKIMNNGRLLAVSQGNYIGNTAPYGYEKTVVLDGKRKCHTLKINEEQAEVVRLMFDLYVNKNMGRHKICDYFDSLGIPAPKAEHWSPYHMADMLENVHYIGKVKWNRRKTVTKVEDSKIIHTRPKAKMGEYLIFEGKHEAIIDEELFNKALEKKGKCHRTKASTKVRNPLVGILWCNCGRSMLYQTHMNKGVERSAPRLVCAGQKYCKSGSVLYSEMIDRVVEILENCIADFEIKIKNDTDNSAKLHEDLIKRLEKKLEEVQARELSQWHQQSHPDESQRMPADIFKVLNEKVKKEKAEIQEALNNAKENMPKPVNYEEKVRTFKDALKALRDPNVDAEKKNILLKSCIERIEYKREQPQQIRRAEGVKKGEQFKGMGAAGRWTSPPIEIDVKLKV